MNRNWYAVYTKPQTERKVAALLLKKKIESFCPHNRVIAGYGNKRKMVYEPLFPTFVFVLTTEFEMYEVRRTADVINFVYWLGKPAIIKTAEIEKIAQFSGAHYNIKVERSPVNAAAVARIVNEAALTGVSSTKVKLNLPSLGFTMYAETTKELAAFEYQAEVSETMV
jgi:transcription antitermination factor NusG